MNRLLIGIGGAGNNIINNIIEDNQLQIDTLVINSDKEGIESTLSNNQILLDTEKYQSIERAFENVTLKLSKIINKYSNLFIVLGFGGECGTRTIKIFHKVIEDKDIIANDIGIMPFNFEGRIRKKKELQTIEKTKFLYEELKLFENQSLFKSANSNTTLEAFKLMDNNIASYIKNSSLIYRKTSSDCEIKFILYKFFKKVS